MKLRHLTGAIAVALVLASATGAAARLDPSPNTSTAQDLSGARRAAPPTATQTLSAFRTVPPRVAVAPVGTRDDGVFDWADVGLGAGAVFALFGLGLAGTRIATHNQSQQGRRRPAATS